MEEPWILGFGVYKCGKQFEVSPSERYKDESGTEKTRWVNSKKLYFDTLDLALEYIASQAHLMID